MSLVGSGGGAPPFPDPLTPLVYRAGVWWSPNCENFSFLRLTRENHALQSKSEPVPALLRWIPLIIPGSETSRGVKCFSVLSLQTS
jgi:hypothetical protein